MDSIPWTSTQAEVCKIAEVSMHMSQVLQLTTDKLVTEPLHYLSQIYNLDFLEQKRKQYHGLHSLNEDVILLAILYLLRHDFGHFCSNIFYFCIRVGSCDAKVRHAMEHSEGHFRHDN